MSENEKVVVIRWYGPGQPRIIKPTFITEGWDYLFLSDRELDCKPWDSLIMRIPGVEGELESKVVKAMFPVLYPQYEWSVFIDTEKYIVNSDLDMLIEQLQPETEFAALRHRKCKCTYHEISRNRKYGRDTKESLDNITTANRTAKLPEKAGLFDTSIIIRRHTERLNEAMQTWGQHLRICRRDQCSVMLSLFDHEVNMEYLGLYNYKHYKKLRQTSDIYAEKAV